MFPEQHRDRMFRMMTFLSDRAIYERVIRDAVPRAARRVWIATADIKDLYVEAAPGSDRMVPFVKVLSLE